jgi:hypothetical protein
MLISLKDSGDRVPRYTGHYSFAPDTNQADAPQALEFQMVGSRNVRRGQFSLVAAQTNAR